MLRNRMSSVAPQAPYAHDRRVRPLVAIGLLGAVVIVGYAAAPLYGDVFTGTGPTVPLDTVSAVCESGDGRCAAAITRLNPGRFRVVTAAPARSLTIGFEDTAATGARAVMIRLDAGARLLLESGSNTFTAAAESRRTVIAVPAGSHWDRLTVVPAQADARIIVSEFGLLQAADDVRGPAAQPLKRIPPARFYSVYAMLVVLAVAAFIVIVAATMPAVERRWLGPVAIAAFCWSVCILELGTTFSPYWSRDLRSVYAIELESSGATGNLTGGLYVGARLADGLGITVPPGIVEWHRMPGYGIFCAIAALIGRSRDVIDIAVVVIGLQALLYSVAVGVLVAAAQPVFGITVAWLLGVLLVLMPKQIAQTQADSLVVPIAILGLAALLHVCAADRGNGSAPLTRSRFAMAAFAGWFAIRNDVLPGWLAISALLTRRRWPLVLLTIGAAGLIAIPWALYKRHYRHEFDLLPTNTGEVLFLSLCEVPGAFHYPCTDTGYFEWAARISPGDPTSARTSNRAVREVIRHWMTYPVHFVLMVWFKFRRFVFDWAWPGFQTPFNAPFIRARERGGFLVLITAVALSIAVDHQRRRSVLLGWPLLFDLPIFLIVFASAGRFAGPAGVSAVVAGIPLLLERGLYDQIRRHRWRAALVVGCSVGFALVAAPVEQFIVARDALHYWTPLLDPRQSSLMFGVHP
ncbi:MAG TPA: hypothetical protein VKE96_28240 [Vicinamibacterales bacterium]|nr:hypothetical protein [Vicinamibacterales bacterium]